MIEFWRAGGSSSTTSLEEARSTEAQGWDGQMFMDSQSLCADPYVRMGIWAAATERLKVSTGVTNPSTRHPAVTAAAAATLQSISNGRAVLGIGRGDSALAYLGYAPANLTKFRQALVDMQTLLAGGEVDFAYDGTITGSRSLESISLGGKPTSTKLKWLPPGLPKVPMDVAATGPKVIEMAAAIAEQVTFSVGGIPERVAWAIGLANQARAEAGLPKRGVSYGAQLIILCHPDIESMREVATSMVAPLARFQIIQGKVAGPVSNSDAENFDKIWRGYDMTKHGIVADKNKIKGDTLDWAFVSRFAIVGTPEQCTERLIGLAKLGITRFVAVGPGFYQEADRTAAGSLFSREVIPAVKAAFK